MVFELVMKHVMTGMRDRVMAAPRVASLKRVISVRQESQAQIFVPV